MSGAAEVEVWRPVPGWEGLFSVSDHGRVRDSAGLLANLSARHGYPTFYFYHAGKGHTLLIHRVVLRAFRGEPAPGQEACHNDGDKTNNHLSNLRWDTRSANQRDRVAHAKARGRDTLEPWHDDPLTTAIRTTIRKAREARGWSQEDLGRRVGVTGVQVCRIENGQRQAAMPTLARLCSVLDIDLKAVVDSVEVAP